MDILLKRIVQPNVHVYKQMRHFYTANSHYVQRNKNTPQRFQYCQNEISIILTQLNKLTEENLLHTKIPKRVQSEFFNHKSSIGSFSKLEDLLKINGVGKKLATKLCEIALTKNEIQFPDTDADKKQKTIGLSYQVDEDGKPISKYVDPYFSCDDCKTLVSISVNPTSVAWTHLDCVERKILSVDYFKFDQISQGDLLKMHQQVLMGVCQMPEADLFVLEHNPNNFYMRGKFRLNRMDVNYLLQNAMIRGILATLCQSKSVNGCYFLNESVLLKLFNLRVDNTKRKSSIEITTKLLTQQINYNWLNLPKLTENSQVILQKQSHFIKNMMCDSLLLATTFLEIVIDKNQEAIKIVN